MELWDAYDKDFKKIDGITLVRGKERSIPDGVFHLVCGCIGKACGWNISYYKAR